MERHSAALPVGGRQPNPNRNPNPNPNPNPDPDPDPDPNPNQVDEHGNPALAPADDDDVPALRVRLEGPLTGDDDVYDEGARPPTLLPVEFEPNPNPNPNPYPNPNPLG